MKKSKGDNVNYLGILFGLLSLVIIILSLVFLVKDRHIFRGELFPFKRWERAQGEKYLKKFSGRERAEGEEILRGLHSVLDVKNVAGSIEITGWDKDYFLIKYVKSGPTSESIENLMAKIETTKDSISIKRSTADKRLKSRGTISFDIFIPDTVKSISVNSVSGSIELGRMDPGITQSLKTVSGKIETDNSGNLQAGSTSGSITFRFSGSDLRVNTVSGSIRGEMLNMTPGGSLDLSSVSGSIHVDADKTLNAEITLKSVSGSISCDFPVTISMKKRNRLEGKIGDGLIPLSIKTTSGSIKIRKL
jgi:DUF4097 and DUF4098 domain-containing protein YvlB